MLVLAKLLGLICLSTALMTCTNMMFHYVSLISSVALLLLNGEFKGLLVIGKMAVVVFLMQIPFHPILMCAQSSMRFAIFSCMANWVTLTSKASEVIESLSLVLRSRTIAIAVSMVMRCAPMILRTCNETIDAHRAKGIKPKMTSVLMPVTIRSLKATEFLAEAMIARG